MEQADFLCYRLLEGWEGWLEQQAGVSGRQAQWGGSLGPGHSHEREEQAWDGASFLIAGSLGFKTVPEPMPIAQLL